MEHHFHDTKTAKCFKTRTDNLVHCVSMALKREQCDFYHGLTLTRKERQSLGEVHAVRSGRGGDGLY